MTRKLLVIAALLVVGAGVGTQVWASGSGKADGRLQDPSQSRKDKGADQGMVRVRAIGQVVDGQDPIAVENWALGICREVTIEEAAQLLQVEPSLSSVLDALTGSLPKKTQGLARQICERQLTANS